MSQPPGKNLALMVTNQLHNVALTDPSPFRASTRAVEGVSLTTTGVALPSQTIDFTSFMYISMCAIVQPVKLTGYFKAYNTAVL